MEVVLPPLDHAFATQYSAYLEQNVTDRGRLKRAADDSGCDVLFWIHALRRKRVSRGVGPRGGKL